VHPDLINQLAQARGRDLLWVAEPCRLASSSKAKQRGRKSAGSEHPYPFGMCHLRSAPARVDSTGIDGEGSP
jgi:hypothetical protein